MKKIAWLVILVMLTVSILSGCNGSDNQNVIKVGILGPHTGEYAKYGKAVLNGALMYIEKVNNEGGINGKQIKPIIYDQKGKSEESITAFQRMVDEGITALIGDVLSGDTITVVGEANPINMPMITASATAEAVTYDAESGKVYENVFRACFIDPFQGTKMAEYAKTKLNAKTAAIIFQTGNDYAVGLKDAFIKKANELGLEVVATEGYAKGDMDFKSQLTNIKSKNPDVVFAPNYYQDCALIVEQAREVGLTATFMGGDGWASVTEYADADVLEGSVYCAAFASGATEEMKNFEKEYIEKYGSDTFNMFSALGYDAAVILLDAIKKAEASGHKVGSDEYKQEIIKGMKNTNVKGITSDEYKFDEYNNPIKDTLIIKIENGKEVFLEKF